MPVQWLRVGWRDKPFLTSSWTRVRMVSPNTTWVNPQLRLLLPSWKMNKNAHRTSLSFLYFAIQNSGSSWCDFAQDPTQAGSEAPFLHLLTHMHSDHTNGLSSRFFGYKVYCSEDAKQILLRHEVFAERELQALEPPRILELTPSHIWEWILCYVRMVLCTTQATYWYIIVNIRHRSIPCADISDAHSMCYAAEPCT